MLADNLSELFYSLFPAFKEKKRHLMNTTTFHVQQLPFISILATAFWKGQQYHCQNTFKFWPILMPTVSFMYVYDNMII